MAHINSDILRLGVDVGSTTVKAVALDPADNSVLFTRYQRHNAHQADTVRQLLEEAAGHFPGMRFRIGVCGSGGRPIAAALGAMAALRCGLRALDGKRDFALGRDAHHLHLHGLSFAQNVGKLLDILVGHLGNVYHAGLAAGQSHERAEFFYAGDLALYDASYLYCHGLR